jgi:hypothetical protein
LEYYFGADEIAKVRKFKIERGVKRDFPNWFIISHFKIKRPINLKIDLFIFY